MWYYRMNSRPRPTLNFSCAEIYLLTEFISRKMFESMKFDMLILVDPRIFYAWNTRKSDCKATSRASFFFNEPNIMHEGLLRVPQFSSLTI